MKIMNNLAKTAIPGRKCSNILTTGPRAGDVDAFNCSEAALGRPLIGIDSQG
jgi:hypothetical protein